MARILKSGEGWRLGWDPEGKDFQGLVGGDRWSLELTAEEFRDFCRLFQQLAATMAEMAPNLVEEERILCEAESALVWLEAEGYPAAYEIHVMVRTGRRGEGFWPVEAIPAFHLAVQTLGVF